MPARAKASFKVRLQGTGPKHSWFMITVPDAAKAKLGIAKARMPIAGTIDGGTPFRTSAAPMGGGHCFAFTRELQSATGKGEGDEVRIDVWRDDQPRTVEVPKDLAAALRKNAAAKAGFDAHSYTHRREFVQWIEGAKKAETRACRVAEVVKRAAARKTT